MIKKVVLILAYRLQDALAIHFWLLFAVLCSLGLPLTAQQLRNYVQPFSGTAAATTLSAIKHSEGGSTESNANTIPAVTLPFAMTQWTPQTRTTEVKCQPPYFYKDSLLSGFRASHWLSGSCTQDYGSVTVMPVVGKLKTVVSEYAVRFKHEDEDAGPAYYAIALPKVKVEMSATLRCGILRFTAMENDSVYIVVTPNSDEGEGFVKVDQAKGELWGYNPVHRIYQGWGQSAGFSGWFVLKVQREISRAGVFQEGNIVNRDSIGRLKDIGGYLGFFLKKGEQLVVKIGTSFTSLEGARRNLQQEVPGYDFNSVRTQSERVWEKALGQIQVTTSDEKDKRIFYTALYHSMQHPRLMSDADGLYPGFSGSKQLNRKASGHYYDDFSMWDTYRAQLPLFEILQPALVNDFVQSLILKGQQGGWLPIFPCWNSYTAAMIGDHATAFIASAYQKGIRNYDIAAAYRLMRKNAFETPALFESYKNGLGRRALASYLRYGYIPMEDSVPEAFHKKEQVSRTLEYAFDDYALSKVAKGLQHKADYAALSQRSLNYKNVFDPAVGMVRGRYADGNWVSPFYPDKRVEYITEGTPRQYSFYVPQDVPGLGGLMGGDAKLELALDSLFGKNEYWHGNEPGHQIPFLYNYTASPWKTQQQVRKIIAEEYSDGPGGLSGNDDAGQMSAWFVFAAMGFYPVDPVSGNYQLVSPLFDRIQLKLPGNKTLSIICHKEKSTDQYIKQVKWNGNLYPSNFLQHAQIAKGGTLEIWLQSTSSAWGASTLNRPKRLIK